MVKPRFTRRADRFFRAVLVWPVGYHNDSGNIAHGFLRSR
jgi:hypothetical protein